LEGGLLRLENWPIELPLNGDLWTSLSRSSVCNVFLFKDQVSVFENFEIDKLSKGWGWLGYNKTNNKLEIVALPNQDPLSTVSGGALIPLLGIDVWEHAYYLQYKNARTDYLKAIWQVVNWKNVADRLATAQAQQQK
jgi:superoxide dismutase